MTTTTGMRLAEALDARLRGSAIGPEHADYETARHVVNRMFDPKPAVIARCIDADDVAEAVRFAQAQGIEVAVRGGGHGADLATADSGLVIDLGAMRGVHVDPQARVATVGGGALAGDVDRATHPFGLATPQATVSSVGVSGFTLSGGVGYLNRAHGLAVDNLVGADVVLADGRRVRTDEHSEPDLFWALRGGGGNFGVVTELRLRLHPVSTVVGGPMLWALEDTERILALYREWILEQPEDIYAFFAVMGVPPADPFPEQLHLRPVCALAWCNTAPAERAQAALDTFRAEANPLLDGVGELPYPALQSAFDQMVAPATHTYLSGHCFERLPDEAPFEYMRFGERMPSWMCQTHLYPLDGAAARVGASETAWAWRDARFAQIFIGAGQESHRAELRGWAVDFAAALEPHAMGGVYANFLMDEGPDRARAAYGANYRQLARIKATYDPGNFFHRNQNIRPTP
jgi:FAD/FMN-containing dehydrogenase